MDVLAVIRTCSLESIVDCRLCLQCFDTVGLAAGRASGL